MTLDIHSPTPYRWVLLALAWMTQVAVNASTLIMPSLASQIIPALKLNAETYHMVITAQLILPIFLSPFTGGLGDRFGVKRVIGAGMAVVALAGIGRIWAQDFALVLVLMMVIGAATAFIQPNVPKLVGVWFPTRQMGLATGIYVSGQAVGQSLGLMCGPLFNRWQDALLTIGLIVAGMTVLWFIFGRSYPAGTKPPKVPVMAGMAKGVRSRSMWMLAIGMFLLLGAFMSYSGNMPRALVAVHGVPATEAAFLTSVMTWSVLAGAFVLPPLSDRLGRRKPFLVILPLICAASWIAAWFLAPGPWTAVLMALGGIAIGGGFVPLLFTLPLELPEIGHAYVGGAAGLINTASNLGGVLIATLAMAPLVEGGTAEAFTRGFVLAGVLAAAIAIPMTFVKETGWKAKRDRV
jgi:MFS family permease